MLMLQRSGAAAKLPSSDALVLLHCHRVAAEVHVGATSPMQVPRDDITEVAITYRREISDADVAYVLALQML